MTRNDTKKRERAAQLVAEDRLSDEKIAEELEIGRKTLARWKTNPAFVARVEAITAVYAKRVLGHGIARKERRVAVLDELHEKLLQVVSERGASPDLADVPGGKTGLVTKTRKGLGSGDNFQVVEEYEVDCATIREIRGLHEQVAKELGQITNRTETVDLTRWFEKMTPAELEVYAKYGTLPGWFPARQVEGSYVS